MSQFEPNVECAPPGPLAQPTGKPTRKLLARGVVGGILVVMLAFLVYEGQSLWREWTLLQGDLGDVRQTQIIGYRDVAPIASYAQGPKEWYHDDGQQSLLWSHWESGVGHRWFHFSQGEIDQARLKRPRTPYVSRAIDYPLVETRGGEIWQRIPAEAPVLGLTLLGLKCVYPVAVLGKVQVVNDLIQDHPYLIAANAFAPANEAFSIFDAELDGHRVTMAASGYFHDQKPLLYDRGTESLWFEEAESLRAVAGKHRGTRLPRVAHPSPVSWKTWLTQNQQSRLLVGADRSRGVPHE